MEEEEEEEEEEEDEEEALFIVQKFSRVLRTRTTYSVTSVHFWNLLQHVSTLKGQHQAEY
jgi:hypothetical protein